MNGLKWNILSSETYYNAYYFASAILSQFSYETHLYILFMYEVYNAVQLSYCAAQYMCKCGMCSMCSCFIMPWIRQKAGFFKYGSRGSTAPPITIDMYISKPVRSCPPTTNHHSQPLVLHSPTFKEPDIALFVFIGSVDVLWNAPPVSGGQGRVSRLQAALPDAPGIAGLEKEQFPTDYRHSIKVRVTGVRL